MATAFPIVHGAGSYAGGGNPMLPARPTFLNFMQSTRQRQANTIPSTNRWNQPSTPSTDWVTATGDQFAPSDDSAEWTRVSLSRQATRTDDFGFAAPAQHTTAVTGMEPQFNIGTVIQQQQTWQDQEYNENYAQQPTTHEAESKSKKRKMIRSKKKASTPHRLMQGMVSTYDNMGKHSVNYWTVIQWCLLACLVSVLLSVSLSLHLMKSRD